MSNSPVREYREILDDSGTSSYVNRILIGTPVIGNVRVEWMLSRYGQIVPINWSQVAYLEMMVGYYPLRYQVADAQNLIVKIALERDFEWCLFWEHDTIAPPDALIRLNEYIKSEEVPVVSGLYYTRSRPSEPIVFRGRGTSTYTDWEEAPGIAKPGMDKIWVDGVPTGFLLVHCGILREMWKESEEYTVHYPGGNTRMTRRVFNSPRELWLDPNTGDKFTLEGTSDLQWCTRVMEGGYFKKAGWDKYQDMEFPFLIDAGIYCKHINSDGEQFP